MIKFLLSYFIFVVSYDPLLAFHAKNGFLWCSWCHRIFPIQATCSLNEKELQTVVSKLVLQFMNDKQQHEVAHPVKVKFKPITSADTLVIFTAHY